MFRKTASIFVAAIAACCAFAVNADGFDGKTLTTNDWFDASFTALAVDTVIATNTATGITFGAGTWTSAPTNGTAKIVADEDAGGGATMLAIDAPGEELTFTPAALASATGMETLTFDVCTEAVDELLTPDAQPQAAFTIYSDDGVTYALKGYVDGGWTNLEYAAGADTLTNVWFTLYLDFATVSSVRYVRFSVKPAAAASATVLTDSEGTAWFPAAVPAATTVNSVSVTGTGSFRTFSGDSLAEMATDVASYNGINYASVAAAVAAGEADGWAHGSVTLLANATWAPTAKGTYNIDVGAYDLTIPAGTVYTASGTSYVVSGFEYYWQSAVSSDGVYYFNVDGNWKDVNGDTVSGHPTAGDLAVIDTSSTIYLNGDVAADISATANVTFINWSSVDRTISGSLSIGENVKATLESRNAKKITLSGALMGEGVLYCKAINKDYSGVDIGGDTSAFAGTVNFFVDGGARYCRITSAAAANNANSTWNISTIDGSAVTDYTRGDNYTSLKVQNSTFTFGALDALFFSAEGSKRANIVIGGKNKDSSLKGRFDTNGNVYTNSVYWTDASATLTFGMTNSYILGVTNGGAVDIVDSASVPASFGSNTRGGIYLNGNGGYLVMSNDGDLNAAIAAAIASVDADAVFGITNSVAVELDLSAKSSVLAGKKLGKKGSGGLAITGLASHGDVTVFGGTLSTEAATVGAVTLADDATLAISAGATIASLSAGTDAELSVDLTSLVESASAQPVVTVTEGTDLTGIVTFVTNDVNYAYSFSGIDTGSVTVTVSRKPEVYVWCGAAGADWKTPSNWTIDGVAATLAPSAIDTARFDDDATCNIKENNSSKYAISNIVIAANKTLTLTSPEGSVNTLYGIHELGGLDTEGDTVVLSNANLQSADISLYSDSEYNINWYADINVLGSLTNFIYAYSTDKSSRNQSISYYGNISGTGTLSLSPTKDVRTGVQLYGDNGSFAGVCIIRSGASTRGPATFCSATAGSEKARWIYPDGCDINKDANAGKIYLTATDQKIKFGTFEGTNFLFKTGSSNNPTVEIGALNLDFDCALSAINSTSDAYRHIANSTLRKVGTGTMTFGWIKKPCWCVYEMNGGVLKFDNHDILKYYAKDSATNYSTFKFTGGTMAYGEGCTNTVDESLLDVSAYVKNSSAPISVLLEDGQSLTWATALASSNTDGLVKKGEGALTLSAAPLYTGDTYLDGGTLKIPTSANKTVKTHVAGKSVRTGTETIGEVEYTVYTLVTKRPTLFMVY